MITIDKAIQLLNFDLDDPGSVAIEDLNEAQELGVEALKHIQSNRRINNHPDQEKLPGEI